MNARKPLPLPPPHPLTAEEREQATLWETPLKDHVVQRRSSSSSASGR